MESTYFYKAEMPSCQEWTLGVSKLNILISYIRSAEKGVSV